MSYNPGLSSKNTNFRAGKNQFGQHVQSSFQQDNYNQNNQKVQQQKQQNIQSNVNNNNNRNSVKNIVKNVNYTNGNKIQSNMYPTNNYYQTQDDEEQALIRQFRLQKARKQQLERETSDKKRQQEALDRLREEDDTRMKVNMLKKGRDTGFIGKPRHKTSMIFNQEDGTFTRCEDMTWSGSMHSLHNNPKKCNYMPNNTQTHLDWLRCCDNNKDSVDGFGGMSLKNMVNNVKMIIKGGRLLKTRSDFLVDGCVTSEAFAPSWKVDGQPCAFAMYSSAGDFQSWDTSINEHVQKIWDVKGMESKIKILGKITEKSLSEGIGAPKDCVQNDGSKYKAYLISKDSKFMKSVEKCKGKFKFKFGENMTPDNRGLYVVDTRSYEAICSRLLRWRDQLGLVDNYCCKLKRPNCGWDNQKELCRLLSSCSNTKRDRCVKQFYNKPCKAMAVVKLNCKLVRID